MGDDFQKDPQPAAEIDEEEAKKRRAGQSIDAGNPANMELGANIRPDVGSSPRGLETYTTQKSSTYEANPEAKRSERLPTMRNVGDPDYLPAKDGPLTRALLYEDAGYVLDNALPDRAGADLLIQAFVACQMTSDFAHVLAHHDGVEMTCNELEGEIAAKFFERYVPNGSTLSPEDAASRFSDGLIAHGVYTPATREAAPTFDVLQVPDFIRAVVSRGQEVFESVEQPLMTLEAIAADPWNAVELPLPANADQDLLVAVRDAADHFVHSEHHLMLEARAGRNSEHWSEELHAAGIPQPDAHEYNEDRWLQALDRFELVTGQLAERQQIEAQQQGDGLTPPEVAESAPTDAKEARRERRNAFLKEEHEARQAERHESGEEITAEEGETITRDLGGGLSL